MSFQKFKQNIQQDDDEDEIESDSSSEEVKRGRKQKKVEVEVKKKTSVSEETSSKKEIGKHLRATNKQTTKSSAETSQKEQKNINSPQKNSKYEKKVTQNAEELTQADSEKQSVNNTRQNGKKQQKINEKQKKKGKQNSKKIEEQYVETQENGAEEQIETEQNQPITNSTQDKDQNLGEQQESFTISKIENSGEKSPIINQNQSTETTQKQIDEDKEEMNLEKVSKKSAVSANLSPRATLSGLVEEKKDVKNSSDSNLQSSYTQEPQTIVASKKSQKIKLASSQKNSTQTADTDNNVGVTAESPRKKIKSSSVSYYQEPKNAIELKTNMTSLIETFQSKKNQNIFKMNEMKDLDQMCDKYFMLNIPTIDFIQTSLGEVFFSTLVYISQFKRSEDYNLDIMLKLDKIIDNIKEKVLTETFGPVFKELMQKKKNLPNGNGADCEKEDKVHSSNQLNKSIVSNTKLNGDANNNPEKEKEDPKKLKDQQLRKKICKKISELLREDYKIEKIKAQDLCVKIERKIKSVQPELNIEYKNNIKGLIRLLKAQEICIDKLENGGVDELISIIQNANLQADLKNLSAPQFDKNASNIDQSD